MTEHAPVLMVMGPTASGKTELSLQLAERLDGEIISVDSALVYRDMVIGTAKPDATELARAPHHLIDIIDPAEAYSAAQFREDALRLIEEIQARGRVPILAGGTMLYFRALQQGLSELPSSEPSVRARLEADMRTLGLDSIHDRLKKIDPVAAKRIHPNDPQRTLRALEVFELTGISMTDWYAKRTQQAFPYPSIKLALAPENRSILHQRIERRFDMMLAQGFVDEVRALHAREELHADLPAIRAVGYRQVWAYLDGELDEEEMRYRGIVATRQLAKRQFTWLRSEPNLHWLDSENPERFTQAFDLVHSLRK